MICALLHFQVLSTAFSFRNKPKTMSTSDDGQFKSILRDLPRDLIIDILTRLPVRSLLQLRSVCRSWYLFLTAPHFASIHFTNRSVRLASQQEQDHCFLYLKNYSTNTINFDRPVTLLSNDQPLDLKLSLQIPFLTISNPFSISGTCNGIICLSILPLASVILFWNPVTREFKDLPVARTIRFQSVPLNVILGFGYDPVSNDYKLLRIVFFGYPLYQFEIYSLRSNSWREIEGTLLVLISEAASSVCFKGRFYWTAISVAEGLAPKVIVCFDLHDEKFSYITPPNLELGENDVVDEDEEVRMRWNLVALNDRLAIIAYGYRNNFDIWVMKEDGEENCWSKYMSFQIETKIIRVLGYNKSGKILSEKDSSMPELILYDTEDGTVKELGEQNVARYSQVFNHVESLLPIRGGKMVENANVSEIVPDHFFVRKIDLTPEADYPF